MSDQKDINDLMDDASETAFDLLVEAAASLKHLECRADERGQQQEAIIDELHDLRESIDFIAARPDGETTLSALSIEPEFIVDALKAAWLKTYPLHTEKEYIEAMRRIDILAGL